MAAAADLTPSALLPNRERPAAKSPALIAASSNPTASSFAGCTRQATERQIAKAKSPARDDGRCRGEFLHFPSLDSEGEPTTITARDTGGYFDQTPVDRARRFGGLFVKDLVAMGWKSKRGSRSCAGQHEIDFR